MIAVVLNPASGPARRPNLREEIERLFRDAGLEAVVREHSEPGEIFLAAREAVGAGAQAVVVGGGDGTISAAAPALAGGGTPLGVLPLGTLNHFAKDAGLPFDLPKAVETIAARRVKPVDVGRVNDRVFLNNCSIGVYPDVLEVRERLRARGYTKWTAFALATLEVLRRKEEVAIRLDAHRTRIVARTPFIFVGNNEYLAEGLKLGARSRLDGGRLHTYFAPPVRTRDLPKLLVRVLMGRAHHDHSLESIATRELWVETPFAPEINVACDGELVTLATPLHCRSWAGALTVLSPAP